MLSEEGYAKAWHDTEDWHETWSDGCWAEEQQWNDGYLADGSLCYMMSMDTSRRKEQEKQGKARKARMMKAKVESQVMQKASPTSFNLRPSSTPEQQQQQQAQLSSAASSSAAHCCICRD